VSGWRSSEPIPVPSASGTPVRSVAHVVIMIGRKRSRHASRIAAIGGKPDFPLAERLMCAGRSSATSTSEFHYRDLSVRKILDSNSSSVPNCVPATQFDCAAQV
jgi:hypothetical protein